MNFKYQSKFQIGEIFVKPISFEEKISLASLSNLTPLIPNSEVDFNENIDLLGVAFNAAVVNSFNKNDDGIDTQTALKIAKLFKHKPTNIEHKREKVVGHILTAGFSKHGTSEILTPDELIDYVDPFNISLGAVVYKFVNKEFANALENSNDLSSEYFNKISTSWELGFNQYNIAVGSRNLKDAEIITDEKQINELKSKLKSYGGSGKLDDGTEIFRLVVGEVYPLGIGFTTSPAADVKGVIVNKNIEDNKAADKSNYKVYHLGSHFFSKKNSQIKNADVKFAKESPMNLDNLITEIKDALLEKKISQEAAANMTATFTEAIKKKDQEYRDELEFAKSAKDQAEKERAELKASMEDVQKQLAEALLKLQEFEADKKAAEALARFNSRMEEIDSMFDLEDADRQILAEEIKSLDETDESFASFKNKISVIWRNKNKEVKSELEKEIQARIDAEVQKRLASTKTSKVLEDSVEDILDKAKASEATLPNNNESSSKPSQSLMQKFAEAFKKENIIIS